MKNILLVDDSADYRSALALRLKSLYPDARIDQYDPASKGRPGPDFDWNQYDLLLLDYYLSADETGLDWFRKYRTGHEFPTTIMLTGAGSERIAVNALKLGVHYYLSKRKLAKDMLLHAITEAGKAHEKEVKRVEFVKMQANIFSKSRFYKKLEESTRNSNLAAGKMLILIMLDEFDKLSKTRGLIIPDNIVRHTARIGYEHFTACGFNPIVTIFSNHSAALLVDYPGTRKKLENTVKKLCDSIQRQSFYYDREKIDFTVSMGIVPLQEACESTADVLSTAYRAYQHASRESGNSWNIAGHNGFDRDEVEDDSDAVRIVPPENGAGRTIASALNDNRLLPWFRPIMKVSEMTDLENMEFYDVKLGMVKTDGTPVPGKEFYTQVNSEGLEKETERWVLRYCIARLAELDLPGAPSFTFFIPCSKHLFMDPGFFDWLRDLMKRSAVQHVRNRIALQTRPEDVLQMKSLIRTLMESLRRNYGFRIVLAEVRDKNELDKCAEYLKIDYVKLADEVNAKLANTDGTELKGWEIFDRAWEHKALTVGRQVPSASVLKSMINGGIDLVSGDFIGALKTEL